ncbi:MAG TPA: hypothetical protein VI110_04150 [Lapillicoccus sp.]
MYIGTEVHAEAPRPYAIPDAWSITGVSGLPVGGVLEAVGQPDAVRRAVGRDEPGDVAGYLPR